jgi:hypothetical protein
MTVNKFKILLPREGETEINLPVEMTWDFLGRGDSLVDFEKNAIKQVINEDKDFEVARFSHSVYQTSNPLTDSFTDFTDINYNFNFVPSGATSATTVWLPSYTVQGFTPDEVFYFRNQFKKSFFKLDFYDSTNEKEQTNYFTIIIPTQQGATTATTVGYTTQQIKTPIFKLDYIGDKEGYFIYWLKKKDFLNIDTFYMTAKFFDAKSGVFVKMMNRPQSTLTGISKFNFDQKLFFYYKVDLDYTNYTYKVYDLNNPAWWADPINTLLTRVGTQSNPINWFEYINP